MVAELLEIFFSYSSALLFIEMCLQSLLSANSLYDHKENPFWECEK